jgi:hypothetical protein
MLVGGAEETAMIAWRRRERVVCEPPLQSRHLFNTALWRKNAWDSIAPHFRREVTSGSQKYGIPAE